MELFETLHGCCGHNENEHAIFLVELELISIELGFVNLVISDNFSHL